jgi:YVTN family beta-propeller protein
MTSPVRPRIARLALSFVVALGIVALQAAPAQAAPSTYQVRSITVGNNPAGAPAVNESTNTVYVISNHGSSPVLNVIDGATATVTSVIPLPQWSGAVAVNETTNQVYVTNNLSGTVTVIDGSTAAVASTITVGSGPNSIAIDESSNTIYVANLNDDSLSVITGATGTVATTIPVGDGPSAMAFNKVTGTLYVANNFANTVSVVSIATQTATATIPVGNEPSYLAVNEAANTVYLSNTYDFTISKIDGITNTVAATIPTGQGSYPSGVAVDETTGSVYVVNTNYGTMLRIDATTNTVTSSTAIATMDAGGIAVNVTTQQIYIPRGSSSTTVAVLAPLVESRLFGSDRFATSAAISAATFTPGVPVVYIANGLNFPDALSGAAAAGTNGAPVLLIEATTIPAPITAELTRLHPARIVVLGGTGAVSETVKTTLATYTSGTVTRLFGSDRFATSAAISAATFTAGVPVVYIANGLNFPDALSGAAAAGTNGAPVLLVESNGITADIRTELQRLNPASIVVLGGQGSVSTLLEQGLRTVLQPG